MQIHVTDCQRFDQNITVELPCAIHQLLLLISRQFNYDTSSCSVYQSGKELEFGFQLTEQFLESDNTLVLFNQNFHQEKFFNNTDNPVHLPATKFENMSINFQVDKSNGILKSSSDENLEANYYTFLQARMTPQYITINPQESLAVTENNQKNAENIEEALDENQRNAQHIMSSANLSESEKDSVDRLCSLGYDMMTVVQIFLICNRNEEEASNLLSSM